MVHHKEENVDVALLHLGWIFRTLRLTTLSHIFTILTGAGSCGAFPYFFSFWGELIAFYPFFAFHWLTVNTLWNTFVETDWPCLCMPVTFAGAWEGHCCFSDAAAIDQAKVSDTGKNYQPRWWMTQCCFGAPLICLIGPLLVLSWVFSEHFTLVLLQFASGSNVLLSGIVECQLINSKGMRAPRNSSNDCCKLPVNEELSLQGWLTN